MALGMLFDVIADPWSSDGYTSTFQNTLEPTRKFPRPWSVTTKCTAPSLSLESRDQSTLPKVSAKSTPTETCQPQKIQKYLAVKKENSLSVNLLGRR